MRINNFGHLVTIVAILLVGVLTIGLLSTSVLAQQTSSGGGSGASGNSNGGHGGSGGGSHPGNAGGGSGGCMVINGPTKFVPISTTTETQKIKVGSGNSNRPGDTYLIQERTVTVGEYQMTVHTTCVCENTGQRETTSTTQVVGTDTRYSGWRTVSVVKG